MLSRARRRPDVEWVRGRCRLGQLGPGVRPGRHGRHGWTPDNAFEVVDAAGVTVRVHDEVETPVSGDVVRVGETMTSPAWDRPHTEWANLRFLDVRRTG
jgi:hypothetical protein